MSRDANEHETANMRARVYCEVSGYLNFDNSIADTYDLQIRHMSIILCYAILST